MSEVTASSFLQHFKGMFSGILQWQQLDELWETIKTEPTGWYIYPVDETIPRVSVDTDTLQRFIVDTDALLRQEHNYDYCGIVYVDNKIKPSMIKIFDPNRLGAVCGSSGSVVLPRWILSRIPPESLTDNPSEPLGYKRWWHSWLPSKSSK